MATWVTYCCNECDYEAQVSGCSDALFMGYTETMICNTCKELSDYIVETSEGDKITTFTCEECGEHDVVKWNYKTKSCPKCVNGKMIQNKNGAITKAD